MRTQDIGKKCATVLDCFQALMKPGQVEPSLIFYSGLVAAESNFAS